MIVDTGSASNIIPAKLVEKTEFHSKIRASPNLKLQGVTGTKLHLLGTLTTTVIIQNQRFVTEFIVIEEDIEHPLLGLPFLTNNALIIDYSRNMLYNAERDFETHLTSLSRVGAVSQLRDDDETQLTGQARVEAIIRLLKLEESTLSPADTILVEQLVTKYNHVFALYRSEVSFTHVVEHSIPLTSDIPVKCKYRPVPIHAIEDCIKEIDVLLKRGVIERSTSEYSSPVVIVKKGSKFRICIDYRELNKISIASRAAVPALSTLTSSFNNCKTFFSLDCREAFYQVKIKEQHRDCTAWTIPSIGHFRQVAMSLGLRGAPATMQSLLDRILEGMRENVVGYVDDIAGGTKDNTDMIRMLETLFQRLSDANIMLNPSKCQIFRKKLTFLGVVLSEKGIEVDPDKVEAVQNMCLPKNKKMMMSLIGSFNWFRNMLEHFSDLSKPLVDTLKQPKFVLTEEAKASIQILKAELLKAPILIYPIVEETLYLVTDASDYCIGGSIGHMLDGQYHPISYGSKLLSPAERAYPTFKRELFAIKTFVAHWRFYTIGKPFIVYVDHKAITQEKFLRKTNCKVLLTWILELEEYSFEIRYRPGVEMGLVDGLSRLPSTKDKLYPWWESNFGNDNDVIIDPNLQKLVKHKLKRNTKSDMATDKALQGSKPMDTASDNVLHVSNTGSTDQTSRQDPCALNVTSQPPEGSLQNPIIPAKDAQGTWLKTQLEDSNIQSAVKWLQGSRPAKSTTESMNNELRKLYANFALLALQGGVLCFKWLGRKSQKYRLLIWVPKAQRKTVMRNHHDIEASGHLGPAKMLERIRSQLYWPEMKLEITLHCQTCYACFIPNLAYKPNPRAGLQPFSASRHNQILAIDLIGPVSRVNKFKWCLTMIDKFTHYLAAEPLQDAKSPTVAKALINGWITHHGVMEQILSDQGSNLDNSKVIKEVYSILQVKKIRTTAYKPSTNGLAEAANRQLKICLTKYVLEHPDTWPDKLKIITFAYNTSVNKATKYTPFFLLHGREARVPNDLVFGTTSSQHYESQAHLASHLYYQLKDAWDFALDNIGNIQRQQKRYYDKCVKMTNYEEGDNVLVYHNIPRTGRELNKFKPPYLGPFKITKLLGNVNAELEDVLTKKKRIVHVDKLRRIPPSLRNPDPAETSDKDTNSQIGHCTTDSQSDSDDENRTLRKRPTANTLIPNVNFDPDQPEIEDLDSLEQEIEQAEQEEALGNQQDEGGESSDQQSDANNVPDVTNDQSRSTTRDLRSSNAIKRPDRYKAGQ